MGDHVPLAKRAGAEVDAFAILWRRRRWLAVVLLLGLVAFVVCSIASIWIQAKQIDRLQAEKNQLEVAVRETERENRGLREIVAPLLARASREFPGEEINTSLKKLLERLEAERPGNRPLASASATVEVVVNSPAHIDVHLWDMAGLLAFGNDAEALLSLRSGDSFAKTIGTNEVLYRAILRMPDDDKMVGKPLRNIAQSEYILVELAALDENKNIVRGKATVVFNGNIHAEFEIPTQKANGRRIFVRQVQDVLHVLLQ